MNLLFSFTPIAFCLHCYVMGITEINEHIFMGTFLVGQSPHIFFGVLTGSALLAAETASLGMDWFKIVMLAGGVLGTFIAIVYIGSVAQVYPHPRSPETPTLKPHNLLDRSRRRVRRADVRFARGV